METSEAARLGGILGSLLGSGVLFYVVGKVSGRKATPLFVGACSLALLTVLSFFIGFTWRESETWERWMLWSAGLVLWTVVQTIRRRRAVGQPPERGAKPLEPGTCPACGLFNPRTATRCDCGQVLPGK